MSGQDFDLTQQDIPNVREKPIAEIEKAARALVQAKEAVAKATEKRRTREIALANAMKAAGKKAYVSKAFQIELNETEKIALKDLSEKTADERNKPDLD
jgi:hypothetical protein